MIAKGNAGIPKFVEGHIHYDGTPELMADYAVLARDCGARIIGGCCGTTPAHLRAMRAALEATPQGSGARSRHHRRPPRRLLLRERRQRRRGADPRAPAPAGVAGRKETSANTAAAALRTFASMRRRPAARHEAWLGGCPRTCPCDALHRAGSSAGARERGGRGGAAEPSACIRARLRRVRGRVRICLRQIREVSAEAIGVARGVV